MGRTTRLLLLCGLLLSCASCGIATTQHGATQAGSHPHGPANWVMVLGDSGSSGTHVTPSGLIPGDWQCASSALIPSGRAGWACLFWSHLKDLHPSIKIQNLAVNGDDSCSMIALQGCPGGSTSRYGPSTYDWTHTSQLHEALRFLRAHHNHVSPITLMIGSNDNAWGPGYIDQVAMRRLVRNHERIVSRLRAAAPRADLLVIDSSDDYPPDLAPRGGITRFDQKIAPEIQRYGAVLVHVHSVLYWPTVFPDPQGDHFSDAGQRQEGATIWAAYDAYLHHRQPVPLAVHPSALRLPPGGKETLTYQTAPGAQASLKLTFPGGNHTATGTADASGTWRTSWSAGHHKGKVAVHACATSRGSSLCVDAALTVT